MINEQDILSAFQKMSLEDQVSLLKILLADASYNSGLIGHGSPPNFMDQQTVENIILAHHMGKINDA